MSDKLSVLPLMGVEVSWDHEPEVVAALMEAEYGVKSTLEALERAARSLVERMEQLADRTLTLREGGSSSINSLGVFLAGLQAVQSYGSEVDRLCAVYDEKKLQMMRLRSVAVTLGVATPVEKEK